MEFLKGLPNACNTLTATRPSLSGIMSSGLTYPEPFLQDTQRAVFVVLRTVHNEPSKPNKPDHAYRYLDKDVDELQISLNPLYSWSKPIDTEHKQQVVIGVSNSRPATGYPRFSAHHTGFERDLINLNMQLVASVNKEMVDFGKKSSSAEMMWESDVNTFGSRAFITVDNDGTKEYIWWEIVPCDVY
jgi:hypothetical protein